ncbi:MAG: rhomboid family intramembrane serine protease [Saprospirales bacterium]|nr:rhomboid family intramembrane serine protease [Saprospirales bacterium]
MFESIWKDIKNAFRHGDMLTRLMLANGMLLVAGNVVKLFMVGCGGFQNGAHERFIKFMKFFSLSSDLLFDLTHPWVIFTSMFLHENIWHALFNILFLMWFGRIVADLIGNRRILPLYLITGLAGAFLYIATAHWIYQGGGYAYGASAAVMGIVVAAGTLAPDYLIRVIIIGDVRLKYIVIFFLLMDVIGLANMSNTGGHIAHLGGAAMGFFFIRQLQEGHDWAVPVNHLIDSITDFFMRLFGGKAPGPKVAYRDPDMKKKAKAQSTRGKGRQQGKGNSSSDVSHQEQLDAILDKIKHSGYDSLTAEEKEFLFNASKKHE